MNKPAHASTATDTTRYNLKSVLLLVLLVQFASLLFLAREIRQVEDKIDQVSQNQMITGTDKMSATGQSRVTLDPKENAVYLPKLRIKLPLDQRTQTFTYSVREAFDEAAVENGEADISTLAVGSYTEGAKQRISCASPVRVKIEDKSNPYNPHEKNVASTKLADGRTLQAYAHTHPDCEATYKATGVDAMAMGILFQTAESY